MSKESINKAVVGRWFTGPSEIRKVIKQDEGQEFLESGAPGEGGRAWRCKEIRWFEPARVAVTQLIQIVPG